MGYIKIDYDLLSRLNRPALITYIALSRYGYTNNGAYASRDTMVSEIKALTYDTLRRGIPELLAAELITAEERPGRPTVYKIIDRDVTEIEDDTIRPDSIEPEAHIPELTVIQAEPKQPKPNSAARLVALKASHPEYVAVIEECWLKHRKLLKSQQSVESKYQMLDTIRLCVETDGRPLEEVRRVVTHLATEWRKYAQSPVVLRKKTRAGDCTKYEVILSQLDDVQPSIEQGHEHAMSALLAGAR